MGKKVIFGDKLCKYCGAELYEENGKLITDLGGPVCFRNEQSKSPNPPHVPE